MFQLEDGQLHKITGLLAGVSMILLFIFCIGQKRLVRLDATLKGMEDFSGGWISTYEEPQSQDKKTVSEVVDLPVELSAKKGTTVWLTHKVPDMDKETAFLVVETDRLALQVKIGEQEIYRSSSFDDKMKACHVIPVSSQFVDKIMTLSVRGRKEKIRISAVKSGNFDELIVQAMQDRGMNAVCGLFLFLLGFGMLVSWLVMQNRKRKKRMLAYAGLEALFTGALLLFDSQLFQYLLPNHLAVYLLKNCLLILSVVLYLMALRCMMNRKKLVFFIDVGILFYGIFYVSIMVLQAFSLVSFASLFALGKVIFGITVILYTVMLAAVVYMDKRKEVQPLFYANGILLFCFLLRIVTGWMNLSETVKGVFVPVGFCAYLIVVWIYALRRAVAEDTANAGGIKGEEQLRAQVVEQINPGLLFSSFQELQNMIKKGSGESVKVIYYISVYLRNNLKAIEHAGEMISFEEELEHILAYLKLQKERNQNLDFTVECKICDFQVPRNSIEPMVENAVKHGIAGRDNCGNVVLRSYKRADGYAIQVIDDGIGFDKKILKRGSSTALLSLFDRLEQSCQAKTEMVSREGKGTVITIVLPVMEEVTE